MPSIRDLLDSVWNELGRANLADDLECVEYIETLLLNLDAAPHVVDGPKRPAIRYNINETPVIDALRDAAGLAGGNAPLFDPHVLFHSTRVQKKEPGAYPTPRHIVSFMFQLLNPATGRSFADFSCGSGGFLAEAQEHFRAYSSGRVVGIELSPSWSRIARGNLALKNHAIYKAETTITTQKAISAYNVKTDIYTGDAFRVCSPDDGQVGAQEFDLIAMDPPSGVAIDPQQARKAIGGRLPPEMQKTESGYSSEVLFSWLMLSRLRPGGRGIIMVPPQMLDEDVPRSNFLLRLNLVHSRRLRAVIQLHEDILAPFNYQEMCILLVENSEREQRPWFFRVERDGYTAEESRDLTTQPDPNPDKSDLPFIEAIVQQADKILPGASSSTAQGLTIHWVRGSQDEPLGLVLYVQMEASLRGIERYEVNSGPQQGIYLLIETMWKDQIHHHVITLPQKGKKHSMRKIPDENAWKRRLYPQMGIHIFETSFPEQQIAIARDGRLLGCTQQWSWLRENRYKLLPERQILVPQEREHYQPPHEEVVPPVEADRAHEKPEKQEIRRYSGKTLPPQPAPFFYQTTLANYFDPQQKAVHERIQALVKQAQGYAIYFTPDQLKLHNSFHVRQTLDLMETLGMIVKVQVRGQQYYRPVTELDKKSEH